MKILVSAVLLFISVKTALAEPDLHEQDQQHIDPVSHAEVDQNGKEQDKRTIFGGGPTYSIGKHVAIHPSGYKYLLGYGPVDMKYVPVVKPVTVLKAVLRAHSWKPITPAVPVNIRQYLPPIVPVPKAIPAPIVRPWQPPVVAKPVVPVKPAHPPVPVHPVIPQPVPFQPVIPAQPVVPTQPVVPVHPVVPAPQPVQPTFPGNYYFFQTPIVRPGLAHQVPFYHVPRPQFPVLPIGATFASPVLTHPGHHFFLRPPAHPVALPPLAVHPVPSPPVAVHPIAPQNPVAIQPVAPPALAPAPVHPVPQPSPAFPPFQFHPTAPQTPFAPPIGIHPAFPPQQFLPQPFPPQHPFALHPPGPQNPFFNINPRIPAQPVVPQPSLHPSAPNEHPIPVHPTSFPVPLQPSGPSSDLATRHLTAGPEPASGAPSSVEYHGSRNLLPFNDHVPFSNLRMPISEGQEIPQNGIPMHLLPARHPHLFQHDNQLGIQPGQTDVQVPSYLPQHPNYRFVQQENPNNQILQNQNIIRPSISLEPPFHNPQKR